MITIINQRTRTRASETSLLLLNYEYVPLFKLRRSMANKGKALCLISISNIYKILLWSMDREPEDISELIKDLYKFIFAPYGKIHSKTNLTIIGKNSTVILKKLQTR